MVALLVAISVVLGAVGALMLLYAGSLPAAAGLPSLVLGVGVVGLAGLFAVLGRIAQAGSQHPKAKINEG